MKRTIPLLITILAGCVLIASRFIPLTESWGQLTAIWFDILEAIAFVLGGGSLLKLQLKKISDRKEGWGYSLIVLLAFLTTLIVGIGKFGVPPNPQQQFYGQSLARLDVADIPDSIVARVAGSIPPRADGEPLPLSVKRQLTEKDGQLIFRGWMTPVQESDLSGYQESLDWQCTVEKLSKAAKPPESLKGQIDYQVNHSMLTCRGVMADDVREALLKFGGDDKWQSAVQSLDEDSHREHRVSAGDLPAGFEIPPTRRKSVSYDKQKQQLAIVGPMSTTLRDALARDPFPIVHAMTPSARSEVRKTLESLGHPLNKLQAAAIDRLLRPTWSVEQLRDALNVAGKAVESPKSVCELADEKKRGAPTAPPAPLSKKEPDTVLNARQQVVLAGFAEAGGASVDQLTERLRAAGPFTAGQAAALEAFLARVPTIAEQRRDLCVELLKLGPLSSDQRHFLLNDYREQYAWRQIVGSLFVEAHVPRYPWSGQYNAEGSAFGWIYEFLFKPLTATIFSLLAFYVASAAFRAFRAKNLEAILLLATAFIILLGQTFAGYWLTSWIPENHWTSIFRIENLRFVISQVFQTAGQRAIMIGVALGLAATSLKVLLGIDRSYLGTGED